MSIPDGLTRIQLTGHLGGTEQWVSSFWISGYSAADVDDSLPTAYVAAGPYIAFRSNFLNCLAPGDGLDSVDAFAYVGGAVVARGHKADPHNGAGGVTHPKQIACVMTLRTALANRSGRGRMYLPFTGATCTADGQFTHGLVDAVVDSLGFWFSELASTDEFQPVVVSQHLSAAHPITLVDADYVPDTQRRRRNKLISARHVADF